MGMTFVTQQQIDDLEAKIGGVKRVIADAKIIADGGADGLKLALKGFKNYKIYLENKITDNFRKSSVTRMIQNQELAGQVWAMTMVISTFENAKNDINGHSTELSKLEKQLSDWNKKSVRE